MDTLNLEKRDLKNKPAVLRRKLEIPGVIYGKGLAESIPVQMPQLQLIKTFEKRGEVYNIKLGSETYIAKIASVDTHPVSNEITHFSVETLTKGASIEMSIPLKIEGDAIGSKSGGTIHQMMDTLDVTGKPKDMPASIIADISNLNIGENLTIGDIKNIKNIEIKADASDVIVMCKAPAAAAADTETSAEVAPAKNESAPEAAKDEK